MYRGNGVSGCSADLKFDNQTCVFPASVMQVEDNFSSTLFTLRFDAMKQFPGVTTVISQL